MYKSPIEVYVNDMLNQIRQQEENQIVAEVSQAVGINVEKEELIKALNYDRNQYYKGYEDGKRASKWIPCSERLPDEKDDYIITYKWRGTWSGDEYIEVKVSEYYENDKWDVSGDVIAWMPLPEPYKAESEGEDKE